MLTESCRFCGAPLEHVFCDLGVSPLSNSFLNEDQLSEPEPFYPLRAMVCAQCFLVQVKEFEAPQKIFSDYAYFSSFSDTWLEKSKTFADRMSAEMGLTAESQVVEIASNDGYLLQYFKARGVPVLGIEPAENVARVAQQADIPTEVSFFGATTARQLLQQGRKRADLLVANNVLAHVPDLNDFVAGMEVILNESGVSSVEFPHLMRLINENQFDTIYHEHFSYFSLLTAEKVFARHRLTVFDVEELPTHGGSLRLFIAHEASGKQQSSRVFELKRRETEAGLDKLSAYSSFAEKVERTKRKLLAALVEIKDDNKSIVAYGAPAKGNTLLNYCGIGTDFIDYTVDRNPHKQGKFLPGTHIPILPPERLRETKPDFLLILPWNLKDEITRQTAFIREWEGKFIVPIPEAEVFG